MNEIPLIDHSKAFEWPVHVNAVKDYYHAFRDRLIHGLEAHKENGVATRNSGDEDFSITTLTGPVYSRLHWVVQHDLMCGKVVFYRPADTAAGRLAAKPIGSVLIDPSGDIFISADAKPLDINTFSRPAALALVMHLAAAIAADDAAL